MTPRRKEALARIRTRNRAYVDAVNARTVCAHCNAQPVEWHNPDHVKPGQALRRIGNMVGGNYTTTTIQAEIDRCTPLCRRCHMREDGRLKNLKVGAPKQEPKPCGECARLYKPLRRGLCNACRQRKAKAS